MAYNTADLDDAFSAGMLTAEDVAESVPQYRAIHEAVETQFPGAATERERFHESLRQLIDLLGLGADRRHGRGRRSRRERPISRMCARYPAAAGRVHAGGGGNQPALKRFLYQHGFTPRPRWVRTGGSPWR